MRKIITVRHLAFMAGRSFGISQPKKTSLSAIKAANPWTLTPRGTAPDLRSGENNRHNAWYEGALEGRAERRSKVKA